MNRIENESIMVSKLIGWFNNNESRNNSAFNFKQKFYIKLFYYLKVILLHNHCDIRNVLCHWLGTFGNVLQNNEISSKFNEHYGID